MAATRRALGVIACVSVLTGCATEVAEVSIPAVESPSASTDAPTNTTIVAPAEPTSSVPGPTAPEILKWSAPLIGGGTINMADFTGQQVLLWFWAPY